jgi:hypothetical protein
MAVTGDEVVTYLSCLIGLGLYLAYEIPIRLYLRRKRRGHPAEEAAVTRAHQRLDFPG